MIMQMLDLNGDWTMNFQKNNDAVILQNIGTRIKEWKNDCFFNVNAGIDWLNRLGKTNQQNGLTNDLKIIIVQTQGVASVISLNTIFNPLIRQLSINCALKTIFSASIQANFNIN